MGHVPATIWDTPGILGWIFDRFASNPLGFAWRALGNGLDLFGLTLFPEDYGPLSPRSVYVWSQSFFMAVLVPALLGYARALKRIVQGTASRATWLLVGSATGLVLSSMVSLGEARYRVPFDAVFIVLAASVWCGAGEAVEAPTRTDSPPLAGLALLAAVVSAVVLTVSHPWSKLTVHASVAPPRSRGLTQVRASAAGRWRPPRSHVFRCAPACDALEVTFAQAATESRLRLLFGNGESEPFGAEPAPPAKKLDGNFYRVAMMRHGEDLFSTTVEGSPGSVVTVVPPETLDVDSVRVQPLYGDGYYSLRYLERQHRTGTHEAAGLR